MSELFLSDIVVPEAVTLKLLSDVARGMNFLHRKRPTPIIHRDLKTDNVLLHCEGTDRPFKKQSRALKSFRKCVALVADLGEARMAEDGKTMTQVGTNVGFRAK